MVGGNEFYKYISSDEKIKDIIEQNASRQNQQIARIEISVKPQRHPCKKIQGHSVFLFCIQDIPTQ